jgi:hypothetical protein
LLEEINLDLSPYKIVLVNPGIAISTKKHLQELLLPFLKFRLRRSLKNQLKPGKQNSKMILKRSFFKIPLRSQK